MEKKKSIILFSNKEEISKIFMQFNELFGNNFDFNNDNWIYTFDNTNWVFVPFSNDQGTDDKIIFIVFDGGASNTFTLNNEKILLLKSINNSSQNVHIVFHSKPGEEIKIKILDIFKNNSSHPLISPIHEMPPNFNEMNYSFLYYFIYKAIYDLKPKSKKIPKVLFDMRSISSVDEMVEIIISKSDVNNYLNIKLDFLLECLDPDSNSYLHLPNELEKFKEAYEIFKSEVSAISKQSKTAVIYEDSFMCKYFKCLCKLRNSLLNDIVSETIDCSQERKIVD